ncbi:purine-nucleoside phosphorylase [Candidatus Sumerlaeota bacterium]|nr:purine-nucleoside phosphorylase [Candidatus Sumerlaeota bacterium]
MSDQVTLQEIDAAAEFLRRRLPSIPHVAVTIGSGLGGFVKSVEIVEEIPFGEIPGFIASTVQGHRGSLILAESDGARALLLAGRKHVYEGHPIQRTVMPVRVLARLGVESLILSNAAGGMNRTFSVGDLMLIRDHINWQFVNPLAGPNIDELGPRFPDMSEPYSRALRVVARKVALEQGIPLREGTYLAGTGPTYETVAEREMLRMFGADAIGMSTVPEVLVAVHAGMRVLGITFISNMLVGPEAGSEVTHDEVLENAKRVEARFGGLIAGILKRTAR